MPDVDRLPHNQRRRHAKEDCGREMTRISKRWHCPVHGECHFDETEPMPAVHRMLYCPICGQRVRVEVPDTSLPEVHRLPEHTPRDTVNLCCGLVVTVTLSYDKCRKCGCNIGKHPSGFCIECFGDTI